MSTYPGEAVGSLSYLGLLSRLALRRAAANLPWVDVLPQEGANVYSILQRDILVSIVNALALHGYWLLNWQDASTTCARP